MTEENEPQPWDMDPKIKKILEENPTIREEVFKEILVTQPNVANYLKTENATLDAKRLKLDQYIAKEDEYQKKKDRLAMFKTLKYFPEPDKVLFALVVSLVAAFLLKAWPLLADLLLTDYARETNAETMFYITGGLNVILLAVLGFFIATAGKPMFVWAKCAITNRPIVELETRYNTNEFICPTRATPDVVRVSKYGAIIPSPDATPMGPHGRKIIKCVPEWGVGVSIRNLLKGAAHNFDMTVLEEYYELGAQETRKQLQSHSQWLTPGLISFVIVIAVIGLLFGPQAMEAVRGMNNEQQVKGDLYACQMELATRGIDPNTIKASSSVGTQTTTTTIRSMTPNLEDAMPAVGIH